MGEKIIYMVQMGHS